jgi:hypothetical protein
MLPFVENNIFEDFQALVLVINMSRKNSDLKNI